MREGETLRGMPAKKDSTAEGPDSGHLAILRRGVTEWNAWRDAHSRALPNFAGATLQDEDLSGANLSEANFVRANLRGANLCLTNLFGAHLSGAKLSGANLGGTDLSEAHLSGADLSGADLREATDSSGSDLSGVSLGETRLRDANLRNVRGLETVRHDGQSPRDHPTRSQAGPLPEGGLIGAGLPEMPDYSFRVEFNKNVWRDLFVVEFGLREVLGDQAYSLEKYDDRLAVTFRSPEDFQKGLETVVAQLAAQEQLTPGILDGCTLKETEAPVEIRGEQLRRLLGSLVEELRSHKDDTQLLASHTEHGNAQAVTLSQNTLQTAVACLPATLAAPMVGRLVEERKVRKREGPLWDIYDRAIVGLQYVNRRMSLEPGSDRTPADSAPRDTDSDQGRGQ